MVESEIEAIEQTNQLKDRIDNKHKALPRPERLTASRESLVTFQDFEDLPLVAQQWEFEIWWKQTDALYFFMDGIPAYIIDEEVFIQWSSAAKPDVPQAFGHSDASPLATHHALMLSLVPFDWVNPATGEVSSDVDEKKVFSTVVVFVHPSQKLSPSCQPFRPWCNLQDHHEWHREWEEDAQRMLLPFVHLPGRQPHDHEQSHPLSSVAGTRMLPQTLLLCRNSSWRHVETHQRET